MTYGAEGIGLCRTEHMFFEAQRLPFLHKMIMSDLPIERREALDALLPFQRDDFAGLFRAMDGLPVIVRLIDPPLHEFLPNHMELYHSISLCHAMGLTYVSCSPYRVPVARLAAAHAALLDKA